MSSATPKIVVLGKWCFNIAVDNLKKKTFITENMEKLDNCREAPCIGHLALTIINL